MRVMRLVFEKKKKKIQTLVKSFKKSTTVSIRRLATKLLTRYYLHILFASNEMFLIITQQ